MIERLGDLPSLHRRETGLLELALEVVERQHIELDVLTVEELEQEAQEVGLEPAGRKTIPETAHYIGSTVVVCRR